MLYRAHSIEDDLSQIAYCSHFPNFRRRGPTFVYTKAKGSLTCFHQNLVTMLGSDCDYLRRVEKACHAKGFAQNVDSVALPGPSVEGKLKCVHDRGGTVRRGGCLEK